MMQANLPHSQTRRVTLVLLIAIAGWLWIASSATAATIFCQKYAAAAMVHQQKANELKCGFPEYGWKAPLQAHITWCMRTSPAQVQAEMEKRERRIQDCRVSKEKEKVLSMIKSQAFCRGHAAELMQLNKKAHQFHCLNNPLDRLAWRGDFNSYFHLCKRMMPVRYVITYYRGRKITRVDTRNQRLYRLDRLRRKAFVTKCIMDRCNEYAKRALDHQARAKAGRCGFPEYGWKAPHQAHFTWCKQVNWDTVKKEIEKRDQRLHTCLNRRKARNNNSSYFPRR